MPNLLTRSPVLASAISNRAQSWFSLDREGEADTERINADEVSKVLLNSATVNASLSSLKTGDGTAASPAFTFTSNQDVGLYYSANSLYCSVNSTPTFRVGPGGVGVMQNNAEFTFGAAADTKLFRDAANQLALRNGSNPQSLAVYGTYTNASNYERLRTYYDSLNGAYLLQVENDGTGSQRELRVCGSTFRVRNHSNTANWLDVNGAGMIGYVPYRPATTDAYDLGRDDRRWKDLFLSGNLDFQEQTSAPGGVADRAIIYAEDNGSGKTRLMVQFGTGAAQQIAIEP